MTEANVTIHAFCSAKGGVGKSTLAIACAKVLASMGRQSVLLDADLTGTSLGDGLLLLAPNVTLNGKRPNLEEAPKGTFFSRSETIDCRNRRRNDPNAAQLPVYLNDILTYPVDPDHECRIDGLLWQNESHDGVLYIPSSPLPRDVAIALGWLYNEDQFAWVQRMAWLFAGLVERRAGVTDIVIDLPPGLYGFAHQLLTLMSYLAQKKELPNGFPLLTNWRVNPMLITTMDRNDILLALEYRLAHITALPNLRILLNRYSEGRWDDIESAVKEHFEKSVTWSGANELMTKLRADHVDEIAQFREVFQKGAMRVDSHLTELKSLFRLEGA